MINRHDSSGSESEEENKEKQPPKPVQDTEEVLRKRQELEDSDASIDFSNSESESKPNKNTLQKKLKNIKTKEELMGKNVQTVVRDKDGKVTDLKDSRQVKLAEIQKLNQRIVNLKSCEISQKVIYNQRNSEELTRSLSL